MLHYLHAHEALCTLDLFTRSSYKDVNLDAKLFTHEMPYGSGSYNSTEDCVPIMTFLQHYLHSIDGKFRRNKLWSFFQEDRKVKLQLHSLAKRSDNSSSQSKDVWEDKKLLPNSNDDLVHALTQVLRKKGQQGNEYIITKNMGQS